MEEITDRNLISLPTIIYKITNIIDNKEYIGQFRQDKFKFNNYWGSGVYITRATKKYGRKNFKKEIIVEGEFNQNLTDALETHYIQLYNTVTPYGYNITKGGLGYSPPPVKIYQFEKDGTFIKEWDSIKDIRKFYNKTCSSISSNLSSHQATGLGYIWSYEPVCPNEKIEAVKQVKLTRQLKNVKHILYVYENGTIKEFFGSGLVAEYLNTSIDSIYSLLRNKKQGGWIGESYVSFIKLNKYPNKIGFYVFDGNNWTSFKNGYDISQFLGMSYEGFKNRRRQTLSFWNNKYFISSKILETIPPKPKRHKQDIFVYDNSENILSICKNLKEVAKIVNLCNSTIIKRLKETSEFNYNNYKIYY